MKVFMQKGNLVTYFHVSLIFSYMVKIAKFQIYNWKLVAY
jgi:hypothetical protein